ncbi:AbrB/MazE/SpoVT family DNA-binding domain-containing protein [Crenothrix polyspora]|nr:AbrB/MazE/SpoVT family DNA-binding domain-containing protein [Crenothrix polyspora]
MSMKPPATATLSSKYQIAIPKAVCEDQDWQSGQEFAFIPKGKGMLMIPVPSLIDLQGIAEGADISHVRERHHKS